MFSTISATVFGFSFLLLLWNILRSRRHGKKAGNNPWKAWTLEWYTSSPPPLKSFDKVPEVRSARPLWDMEHPEDPDWKRGQKQKSKRT